MRDNVDKIAEVWGWSDERIWKKYRIPILLSEGAKKKIERQAIEEFDNKEQHAAELAKWKKQYSVSVTNS